MYIYIYIYIYTHTDIKHHWPIIQLLSSNIIFTFPKINNKVRNIFMRIAFLIFLDICFRDNLIFLCFVWLLARVFVRAKSLQLGPLLCDPMDYGPPGSSIHRVLQARILEQTAMPSSRHRVEPAYLTSPASRFFTTSTTWEALLSLNKYW